MKPRHHFLSRPLRLLLLASATTSLHAQITTTGDTTEGVTNPTWDISSVYLLIGEDSTGTMTIRNGGTVNNYYGEIGRRSGSEGTVTVTGGSWNNSMKLRVGYSGTGTLEISGNGAVTNTDCYIGSSYSSYNTRGTATVSGGSWTNRGNLVVGSDDTGTLTISDTGAVSANNVILAKYSAGTGTLNLSGGTLTTEQVSKGDGGSGSVTFDGGTLRLSAKQTDLFAGFKTGDVRLASNGTLDTQDFEVATSYALSGPGGLTKQGSGNLTLSAANTYSGGTTVHNGTLAVTGSITPTGMRVKEC